MSEVARFRGNFDGVCPTFKVGRRRFTENVMFTPLTAVKVSEILG